MKIGYAKLGRSWKLDPYKGTSTGGDVDVARALHIMSRMMPDDEFHLIGRNSAGDPTKCPHPYPDNVFNTSWEHTKDLGLKMIGDKLSVETKKQKLAELADAFVPMFLEMDAIIVWAGQHGGSQTFIPSVSDREVLTNPQMSFMNYASFIVAGINAWREKNNPQEEIWLCPDPRNYLKARDLAWPISKPVIGQHDLVRKCKHERYGDPSEPDGYNAVWADKSDRGVWHADWPYAYGALEMTGAPNPAHVMPLDRILDTLADRSTFGVIMNENRIAGKPVVQRGYILENWLAPYFPDLELVGKWSPKTIERLGIPEPRTVPYGEMAGTLRKWMCTITTPASGSGWATTKPWECFAHGTVCFFHPFYDIQDHILGDAPEELHQWLRVKSAGELVSRVQYLQENPSVWKSLIRMQREYYEQQYAKTNGGTRMIMDRLEEMRT